MLVKTVLNRVHKVKGFVYEKVRFNGDEIEVEMRPRKGARPICSGCGRRGPGYDTLPQRRFAFVPLWALSVFLIYARRRVDCPRYLTVVYQIDQDCRRLPWIGKDRTAKTLLRFFRMIGKERTAALQFVCSDMWQPYLKVIAKKASQALHILDRFHIVAKLNKAIDEVRAAEAKQLAAQGYEPVLKHSRWCFLKRVANLTRKQSARLADLMCYSLKTVRAYLLKESFQALWEYNSYHWAGVFLDAWLKRAMRSRLEPIKRVARSIRAHENLILNWFAAKKEFSSGIVEGLNYRIKLTIRKAYGYKTLEAAEIALYHALGRLPEPELAHEFC